jgi:hypothetical protein
LILGTTVIPSMPDPVSQPPLPSNIPAAAAATTIVLHPAKPISLPHASGVSLVDRNNTAQPSLVNAKNETIASKHDGVRSAITGASSSVGS